ncbi:MAG: cob(I)yrinic acid a,c-diamide adenosyltransferase [Candidatus Omnitrophota bacterium]
MAITTKGGDKGMTSLYFGKSVTKDHPRIAANGDLDELCSFLGLARSLVKKSNIKMLLKDIQKDLFVAGGEIAAERAYIGKLKSRIGKNDITRLEKVISSLEKSRTFRECCFYLPGESLLASSFDIARTVCRRAERQVVTLYRKRMLSNPYIIVYLNRASDLLYLFARSYESSHAKTK